MSFGEQWKKGAFISGKQGNKGQLLRERGSKDNILSVLPSSRQGNKGTAINANGESSGESAHLSLAWAYVKCADSQ